MIQQQLYNHQQEAFNKLKQVKVGALFMDMGTGKTLVALKLFEELLNSNKVNKAIILAPISSKLNLEQEIIKHSNLIGSIEIYGVDSISMSDRIYLEVRQRVDAKTFLIIDESHYIKNIDAKRSNRAIELSTLCHYKLVMTGTPITKWVKDMYVQMTFLSPLILGYKSYNQFMNNHLTYYRKDKHIINHNNVEWLAEKISPYIYECDITDVHNMPSQQFIKKEYRLNDEKQCEYETTYRHILGRWQQDMELSATKIYKLFIELQKIISNDQERLNILKEIIISINTTQQIIIFTKFNSEIESIANLLKVMRITYSIFNGQHKKQEEWKNGKTRILIANIQTGSIAQNFQNCNYMVFYSNNWDYSMRLQAERRIWRTGQKDICIYIDIKSNSGMENMIFNCLDKKENLLNSFQSLINQYNQQYLIEHLEKELEIKSKKEVES